MVVKFFWDTSVDIVFDIRTNPESEPEHEIFTVYLRLHCEGIPGTPECGHGYMADPAGYDPGSAPYIILDYVEIRTAPDKDAFRRAVEADSLHVNDQDVIEVAVNLVDKLPDGLVEALNYAADECCDGGLL